MFITCKLKNVLFLLVLKKVFLKINIFSQKNNCLKFLCSSFLKSFESFDVQGNVAATIETK